MRDMDTKELASFEAMRDPLIAFHGTGTLYSCGIERDGWKIGKRPFAGDVIERLLGIARARPNGHALVPYAFVSHNLAKFRESLHLGASFSPRIWNASIWANTKIGETPKYALELAAELLDMANRGVVTLQALDLEFVVGFVADWSQAISESRSVIYIVRSNAEHFGPSFVEAYARWMEASPERRLKHMPHGGRERRLFLDLGPEFIIGRCEL